VVLVSGLVVVWFSHSLNVVLVWFLFGLSLDLVCLFLWF